MKKYALFILLSFSTLLLSKPKRQWVNPQEATIDFFYLYAPGILSSETQISRYCPYFIGSTGESISCKKGIETIGQNSAACTFPEIIRYPQKRTFLEHVSPYGILKSIHFGILAQANKQFDCKIKKNNSLASYSIAAHAIDYSQINIAQKKDLAAFKKTVEKEQAARTVKPKSCKHILYGASRGAAVVCTHGSLYHSNSIAAVIAEAPFDCIENTAIYGSLGTKIKIGLVSKLSITSVKKNGISPISVIEKFDKTIPLALIASQADTIVPLTCVQNLYNSLIKAGHKKVHLLVLKKSSHNMYAFGPEKHIYQNFIHAFYKNYNLPHIPEYAFAGASLLA